MLSKLLKSSLFGVLLLFGCAGTNLRVGPPPRPGAQVGWEFLGFIGEEHLKRPLGLTTDPWGNLYVADGGDYRIKKFNPEGVLIGETEGWGEEKLFHPVDLSFGWDLKLYVLDDLHLEVQALDKDLGFLFSLGGEPTENPRLSFPSGLALDGSGRIFVIDSHQDGLFLLSSNGEFKQFHSTPHVLLKPTDVAIGPGSQIWVTDGTGRLLAFDRFGTLIGTMGEGTLAEPVGVAIDEDNGIWVADRSHHSIFLFSHRGSIERFPLTFSPGKLEISSVIRALWVVDQSEAKVAKYKIGL